MVPAGGAMNMDEKLAFLRNVFARDGIHLLSEGYAHVATAISAAVEKVLSRHAAVAP